MTVASALQAGLGHEPGSRTAADSPDWWDKNSYGYTAHLTTRGWAWEFLRRNPAFRKIWPGHCREPNGWKSVFAGYHCVARRPAAMGRSVSRTRSRVIRLAGCRGTGVLIVGDAPIRQDGAAMPCNGPVGGDGCQHVLLRRADRHSSLSMRFDYWLPPLAGWPSFLGPLRHAAMLPPPASSTPFPAHWVRPASFSGPSQSLSGAHPLTGAGTRDWDRALPQRSMGSSRERCGVIESFAVGLLGATSAACGTCSASKSSARAAATLGGIETIHLARKRQEGKPSIRIPPDEQFTSLAV
ncbi:DUF6499 domain-containing protein [Mesorhizobium sp. M0902]|uniref:transcriptional regulator domain-containing protein n=1 Tax=Mesorhizobium sp. M0902 TaxID=2957021 RepID=UPI00333675AA